MENYFTLWEYMLALDNLAQGARGIPDNNGWM